MCIKYHFRARLYIVHKHEISIINSFGFYFFFPSDCARTIYTIYIVCCAFCHSTTISILYQHTDDRTFIISVILLLMLQSFYKLFFISIYLHTIYTLYIYIYIYSHQHHLLKSFLVSIMYVYRIATVIRLCYIFFFFFFTFLSPITSFVPFGIIFLYA